MNLTREASIPMTPGEILRVREHGASVISGDGELQSTFQLVFAAVRFKRPVGGYDIVVVDDWPFPSKKTDDDIYEIARLELEREGGVV